MLQLPMLMKVSSAAIAAAITASITYGQYAVAAGPKGSGLLPPASVFVPGAEADANVDPFAELVRSFAELKQARAKADRNHAMVQWLLGLQAHDLAGFTVRRAEGGLVYDVSLDRGGPDASSRIFLAVPSGPEMSYAVRLSQATDGSIRVEGISCAGHDMLADLAAADAAEAEALSRTAAYLGAPEMADPGLPADCLMKALDAD
ncbi:MAG TPA: hypothetical protein PLR76_02935 [Hyphomonas sp.]|nr:hypothetical protein [Hyphomonas sp.]MCA8905235.1 hypothetical protein [Hyphomonas sp.]MCB9970599.1 hypothetical protein [Hyphomonas sp.]HPE47317.1 hypothetical protein [Hyphomonas sp.]